MKKVQILISTYNGEKYLAEQLDSLMLQDYPNFSVLIRDDGSIDGTLNILRKYREQDQRIQFYQGENLGSWQSFMNLVNKSDPRAAYVAFCDQDDVWTSDKVSTAVRLLEEMNPEIPLLYCGCYIPVDKNLKNIKETIKNINFRPSYGNAIIQDICTGCTAMVNHTAIRMAMGKNPYYMVQHDWWFYLIASCFGKVVYDETPHILYRQHGNNEVGARTTRWEQLKFRIRTFSKRRGNIYKQLEEFRRLFQIEGENQRLTELVLGTKTSFCKRLEMITETKVYRQRWFDDLIYRLIILLGLG